MNSQTTLCNDIGQMFTAAFGWSLDRVKQDLKGICIHLGRCTNAADTLASDANASDRQPYRICGWSSSSCSLEASAKQSNWRQHWYVLYFVAGILQLCWTHFPVQKKTALVLVQQLNVLDDVVDLLSFRSLPSFPFPSPLSEKGVPSTCAPLTDEALDSTTCTLQGTSIHGLLR